MIQITLPKFDFDVTVDTVKTIPYETPGVYLLYGKDGQVMYVGKASDLRRRLTTHFRGTTNTAKYIWSIERCEAFIEENNNFRGIYELFLIEKHHPPLNNQSNLGKFKGSNLLRQKADPEKLLPAFCKFILKDGRQCSRSRLSNGYCYMHGGK